MIACDVCIVGAGPAGASAALFLAKKGINSVVIDKATFPRDKICGDAFSGKVSWVLRKLDIQIEKEFAAKSTSLPSWGVKFFGSQNNELKVPFKLNYNKEEEQAPGFISRRLDFDLQLVELLKKEERITLIENTPIANYKRNGNELILSNEKLGFNLSTKVLLVADGAYSKAAKQLMDVKIPDEKNSLGLRAYYRGVEGLDPEGFIELHFLKELLPGYFWIFPLANGEANVGLGIRADVKKKKRINLKKVFQEIIEKHPILSKRFVKAELIDQIQLHGLPLGGHKKISTDQLILMGDAAALIDPFTGEGIGNAMISGMLAADVIADNYETQSFSAAHLLRYDELVYKSLASELNLSQSMQNLTNYPWLFNFVIDKARKNKELQETISCMFESVDIRKKLRNPLFYLRILFG